jgi:hypothetical protein
MRCSHCRDCRLCGVWNMAHLAMFWAVVGVLTLLFLGADLAEKSWRRLMRPNAREK